MTDNSASPVEIKHLVIGGSGGVQQFSLNQDGHFLYQLQQENSAASVGNIDRLYVMSVAPTSGKLTEPTDLTIQSQLPPNTRPFRVTIR